MARVARERSDLSLVVTTLSRVGRCRPASRVVELGHVDDDTLAALYRGCAALAFPSRHEGFGLPVLEAMSYGAPVIASSASAVPEAGGDAACYVPPRRRCGTRGGNSARRRRRRLRGRTAPARPSPRGGIHLGADRGAARSEYDRGDRCVIAFGDGPTRARRTRLARRIAVRESSATAVESARRTSASRASCSTETVVREVLEETDCPYGGRRCVRQ